VLASLPYSVAVRPAAALAVATRALGHAQWGQSWTSTGRRLALFLSFHGICHPVRLTAHVHTCFVCSRAVLSLPPSLLLHPTHPSRMTRSGSSTLPTRRSSRRPTSTPSSRNASRLPRPNPLRQVRPYLLNRLPSPFHRLLALGSALLGLRTLRKQLPWANPRPLSLPGLLFAGAPFFSPFHIPPHHAFRWRQQRATYRSRPLAVSLGSSFSLLLSLPAAPVALLEVCRVADVMMALFRLKAYLKAVYGLSDASARRVAATSLLNLATLYACHGPTENAKRTTPSTPRPPKRPSPRGTNAPPWPRPTWSPTTPH